MYGDPNQYGDPNHHGEEYADGHEGQAFREAHGYGTDTNEDEIEAEARRQAQAYHAAAHDENDADARNAMHFPGDDRMDDHTGAPRESRKERRRREAAERQARAEAEAAAMAMHRSPDDSGHAAPYDSGPDTADTGSDRAAAPSRSGKFGRWFGKNSRGGEDAMQGDRASATPIEITLPSADRIDPAALIEFGLDPNTLAAMGMDPATLPQFEPEFLVELGINPQIVIEILRRQIAAEMQSHSAHEAHRPETIQGEQAIEAGDEPGSAPAKAKFDMSPAAWIARYRKVQKWAPAAAAVAGLTTTGSIWFLSPGGQEKKVEQVKNEQLAGEIAESALGNAVAGQDEPGISPPAGAEVAAKSEPDPKSEDAPTDLAAEPVSLAMNDLPALPGSATTNEMEPATGEPPAGEMPPGADSAKSAEPETMLAASLAEPPAAPAAEAPPGVSIPDMSTADAPPGLPAMSEVPGSPATNAEPPAGDTSKSGPSAKSLALPAIGGLGAAAAIGAAGKDALGQAPPIGGPEMKSDGGLPDLPKGPDSVPTEAPPGLTDGLPGLPEAPGEVAPGASLPIAEAPPLGGIPPVTEAPPGASAIAPPTTSAPQPATSEALPSPAETPEAAAPGSADPNPGDSMPALPGEPKTTPDVTNSMPETSGLPISIPNASDDSKSGGLPVGKAAAAGAAAGLGAGVMAEEVSNANSKAAEPMTIPNAGGSDRPISAEPPAMNLAETPAEAPPAAGANPPADPNSGMGAPPGSLTGLPKDIPTTPEGKPAAAAARPAEADANWPRIPNSRGKVLRALASTNSLGRNIGQSAAAATIGAGAGMALGTVISNGEIVREPVRPATPTPVFDSAPPDIAPISHTVQSGENFWTISRDYYGSGRYYVALWAANSGRIGKIDELHVGDIVRIPAMENLDKSLIENSNVAKSKRSDRPQAEDESPEQVARSRDARAVRTQNEIESVPIGGMPGDRPVRKPAAIPDSGDSKEIVSKPIGETASQAGYVRHRVQPGETLRTIAASRLGNARRATEIVELNADVLDDVRTPLEPDMILKLPAEPEEN